MLRFLYFVCLTLIYERVTAQGIRGPKIRNCPSNILYVIPYGLTTARVSWATPFSEPYVMPVESVAPQSTFALGKNPVRYTFTFPTAVLVCEFTVDVQATDTEPPRIANCPRGVKAAISPGESAVAVQWDEPTATDNTDTKVSVTASHRPGDRFPLGFSNVNYTFVDGSGNGDSCSFTVTVYLADDVPPIVSGCPADITMEVDNHKVYRAVSWKEPTAEDESGGVNIPRQSHRPGDEFPAGVTSILYVFADESQNIATCTFQIHLDPMVAPRVNSCPQSVVSVNGVLSPDTTILEPVFLTSGSVAIRDPSNISSNKTYSRTDRNGNAIICSYEVYPFVEDNIPPHDFNCHAVTVTALPVLGLGGATAAILRNDDATYSHGSDFIFPKGETIVAYTLKDEFRNIQVCSIRVQVPPALRNCPTDISGEAKSDETDLQVYWPTVQYNVQVQSFSSTHSPGSIFKLGSSEVNHMVTGLNGEMERCTFNVNVQQENPLSVEFCPDSMVLDLPEDANTLAVTWNVPIVDHKLGRTVIVSSNHMPGDSFPAGEVTVEYQYVDQIQPKFEVYCIFNVTVQDVTDPVLSCLERYDVTVLSYYGTFDWQTAIEATDNSGQVAVSSSHDVRFRYQLEDTSVNLTAVDPSGNEASCQFVVSVSLIIALPFLIAIAAVVLLVICCCFCCCCCCSRRGEETGGQEDSVGMDQLSKDTDKASKSFGDSEPGQVQNTYFTSEGGNPPAGQMATGPTAPPVTAGVTNQGMENDEYLYVIGDENPAMNPFFIPETPAVDAARPLPSTPHPSSQSSPIQPAAARQNYENKSLLWSSLPRPADRFDTLNKPPIASPRENTGSTMI